MQAATVDTRVSPSLHPDNVKQIEGYEESAALLNPTLDAFATAYAGIGAVYEARDKAKSNPTWNENQQIIHTSDLAEKYQTSICKTFDNVRANLQKQVDHFEQELSIPLVNQAGVGISSEIRKYAKELTTEERHAFIREAIDSGDRITVGAVLGAPAYLSGLDSNFSKTYSRMWNERSAPDIARKLKAVQAAKQMIEDRAALVFNQLEHAVGATSSKARELREAQKNAEKAFAFNGTSTR